MKRPIMLAVAIVVASSRAEAAETVIDDFESGAAIASNWSFANGAEFPGATGSLSAGEGHASANGAMLAYNFSGGGHYVAATRVLPTPLTAAAVGFWVKAPAGIHAKLRVGDSSGQTFQYDVSRPLEAFDGAAWYRQVIALDAPSSHYGGSNDGVVHQPIKSITVMAADPPEVGATGAIEFDDVVAIDSLAVRVDPSAASLVAPPPGSSDLASRIGVNIHFTSDDRALDLAKGAGFTRVRMDLGWSGVEHTQGTYDFSALDKLVASLSSRGMGLLLILDYFNPLYPAADSTDYGTVTVPAFAAMAKAAAAHFSGENVEFEIWNEPNLDTFWPPKADATSYAALAKAGIAAVHQGNSQAKVTTGGISGYDYAFFRAYLAAGGGDGADAIGVHPYRKNGGESVSDDLLLLRTIVAAALPAAPPVWDTEWGYSSAWYGGGHDSAALKTQAVYAARELLSAWALGFPLAIYYDIRDDGTDPTNAEHNFGLLDNAYGDKPAMVAVRTLTKTVSGSTFAGFIPVEPSSLHALRLDGVNSFVVPLWSDAPGSATTVSVPAGTTGIDAMGAPLTFGTSGGDLTVVVREANGPVYLTFPRPLSPEAGAWGDDASVAGNGGATSNAGGQANGSGGGSAGGAGGTAGAPFAGAPSGTDASAGGSPASSKDSSGCGCALAHTTGAPSAGLAALLVGLLTVRRGRRPGGSSPRRRDRRRSTGV